MGTRWVRIRMGIGIEWLLEGRGKGEMLMGGGGGGCEVAWRR